MRSSRHARSAGAFIAIALTLTACTASPESGSTGEGTLTIYAGRNESLIGPLIEQFTDDTGIEVDVRYATSPELNALLLEEGERTPADVFFSQDAGALGSIASAGLTSTLPGELADLIPAGFTSDDGSWIGVTGRARVIAYDGDDLTSETVPDTVDALTAPEWSGRVAFAPGNASFQSFITALRVLEGEAAAAEWVNAIAANDPILTDNNLATLDLVNSGQADIGLINHYYWFERAAELGEENMRAQLEFLPGDPGGIVNVSGAAILKGAAGDADALAFVEYLVSEAAQRYFVEETFEYPLVPGIDAPEGLPALESLVNPELDLSDLESLEQTQRLLADAGLL
ncbi:iron ABC transporter substrate-binding protein [Agromyces bauzanensis]|uniref:Iron ABC transporter substrate-binding protein n=1 Tax=Agromyces bauzanensis TaxID=1308924 RepID=A0A917PFM4_9MICO|nr:iron ABC transporter substrate-binding protein [Agromyces bauzanensis]GGJ75216.1 iron ABC transporter substrate-binding protein [Agromyces bauzanensis]